MLLIETIVSYYREALQAEECLHRDDVQTWIFCSEKQDK